MLPNREEWEKIFKHMDDANHLAMLNLILKRLRCARLRLPAPVGFALKTAAVSFALLAIFPLHPASMVAALGGGLSFSLFFHLF